MSSQIVLRSPTVNKRQPLLLQSIKSKSCSSSSFAEVARGTMAECATVCCCCPFGLVNFLVLGIYKVPVGHFRKALKKKRRQKLIKKGLLPKRKRSKCKCGCDDFELQIHPVDLQNSFSDVLNSEESERKVMELDMEMWEIFYSTGFWRSHSQRQNT